MTEMDKTQPDQTPILRLHVVQADYGDCLLLQYGADDSAKHILIDGGPDGIYSSHLKYKLEEVATHHGKLDLVVLTHIDEDHVVGLVDMLSEIAQARGSGKMPLVEVSELWYNTFRPIEGGANGSSCQLDALTGYLTSSFAGGEMQSVAYSISQGEDLWKAAHILKIPLNPTFTNHVVTPANANNPLDLGGLKLWIIGPFQVNLDRYKNQWDEWFAKHKNDPYSPDATSEACDIDTSISNLSSIMFLAEGYNRRMLFTGDGKCDDVMAGLNQAGLSGPDGKLHVDVLKVPHHGSSRNNSQEFFKKITAHQYVIPAGKHKNDGNPDLKTLVWLVESAKQRGEQIGILVANPNDSTDILQRDYSSTAYGYSLIFIPSDQHSLAI